MTVPTVAVLDANGIIGLAKADCFPLLQHLFTEVCVPSSVVAEITDAISQSALQNALGKWVTEMNPSTSSLAHVAFIRQEADRHVLSLALDHQASTPDCFLITGDEKLRRRAQKFGLASIDAPHLIQLFAEANLITTAGLTWIKCVNKGLALHNQITKIFCGAWGNNVLALLD